LITALALAGLVSRAPKVDARSESGANLDGGGLHLANKYGEDLK